MTSDSVALVWETLPLGEVALISTGGTPPKKESRFFGGDIPWIKPSQLGGLDPIVTSMECLSAAGAESIGTVPEGSVLICCIGTIGKLGIAGREVATNQQINSVTFNPKKVDPRYGAYYLSTKADWLQEHSSSTTISIINKGRLSRLPVIIPPIETQKRIAAQLDTIFQCLEGPCNRLATIRALLKKFRQSILAAACSGQLTAGWREDNAVMAPPDLSSLVKQKGKKAVEQPIDLELPDVPGCFAKVSICEIVSLIQYGTSSKSGDLESGRVPVLRMGNIQDGTLDWTDLKYTDENKEISSLLLLEGDILFNRTNSPDLVGKTAVFRGDQKATFASYLIRLRVHPELAVPEFVAYWINSSWGREWAQLVKTDGVSQSNINGTKLAAMPIPLPSVAEQTEIVRRVESLFALADSIESRLAEATAQVERTTQAILAKAFQGEL